MVKKVDRGINASNANWKFSGKVAKKFDNHIIRSVPFYLEGHDLICKISDFFLKDKLPNRGENVEELMKYVS